MLMIGGTMKIKSVKISDIIPYENNPRHNDDAVWAVAESIRQCGYCAPIVVDENMVILAGHTRLKALKSLGYNECEVCIKEGLSDEQKRKYRILDNKTNEFAEWDFEALEKELDGLDFDGIDFGFDFDLTPPEILDDDSNKVSMSEKIVVRLVFDDYKHYAKNEIQIKDFAGRIRCAMTVGDK